MSGPLANLRTLSPAQRKSGLGALFSPAVRGVTWRTLTICAISLTAHWAFMFWQQSHIRALPEVRVLNAAGQNHAVVIALLVIMVASIAGNFLAGALAQRWGYQRAITFLLAAYGTAMIVGFAPPLSGAPRPLSHEATLVWFGVIGLCPGVFGLFTMCLPPLFPTLLRTTGAGFCYNLGRVFAAAGTVFFGLFTKVDDIRLALFYAGFLFIPAALVSVMLPEPEADAE